MDLYVYRTPTGLIADFRPYLDGRDHSFDDHRALPAGDARWEKIQSLEDPETAESLAGQIEFAGTAKIRWHELMRFPIVWQDAYEPAQADFTQTER
ncbi:MAG TPA: hypothetical protein VFD71_20775 [Planctomycetota bacterium]|nr:hypothetical protein [Planctomycetota bacterium]